MTRKKKEKEPKPAELIQALKTPDIKPPWVDDPGWDEYDTKLRTLLINLSHPWTKKRIDSAVGEAMRKRPIAPVRRYSPGVPVFLRIICS